MSTKWQRLAYLEGDREQKKYVRFPHGVEKTKPQDPSLTVVGIN